MKILIICFVKNINMNINIGKITINNISPHSMIYLNILLNDLIKYLNKINSYNNITMINIISLYGLFNNFI